MTIATRVNITERAPSLAAPHGSARLAVQIIRAGFNVSGSRYYTPTALEAAARRFNFARMYADHPTASEERERPEGSVQNWVGVLEAVTYNPESQALSGTARLISPQFQEKVRALAQAGHLGLLGVSIRAIGAGEPAVVDGVDTFLVTELLDVQSVDFVTLAGAGGQAVALLESAVAGRSRTNPAIVLRDAFVRLGIRMTKRTAWRGSLPRPRPPGPTM
jgi:hypothetical protein